MVIDIDGNGSMLFQSLDPTDRSLYTWDQSVANVGFVQVANVSVNGDIYMNNSLSFNVITDTVSMGGSTAQIAVLPGFINGCQLSCGSTATTTNNWVAASFGTVADSLNEVYMQLTNTILQKNVAATWAAGNNVGGLANGVSIAANVWLHAHLITVNGNTDLYFDTSNSAANAPTGTTFSRRLGSFNWNSNAALNSVAGVWPFAQKDDMFWHRTALLAVSGAISSNVTMFTPTNIVTIPLFTCLLTASSGATSSEMGMAIDGANGVVLFSAADAASGEVDQTAAFQMGPPTDLASRVRILISISGSSTASVTTIGYIDSRGK
jgi:hypothetical protein